MAQTAGRANKGLDESLHSGAAAIKGSNRYLQRTKTQAWPAIVILCVSSFIPVAMLCVMSVHLDLGMAQVGGAYTLDNYKTFFVSAYTRGILINTVVVGLMTVSVSLVIGYPVAYFLARSASKFRKLVLLAVLAPLLVSAVVRNIGWLPLISANGILNWCLLGMGIIESPISLTNSFFAVNLALINALLPFMILTLMTVIQRIGVEIEEAARNLGASPLRVFFKITLPLSKPGIVSGSLLLFSMAVSAFTTPAIMGGNKTNVISIYIEQQFNSTLEFANGATGAVILLGIATLVSVGILFLGRDSRGNSQ